MDQFRSLYAGGDEKLQIGISSCLVGEEVRWNAGHKRDRYLTDILGDFVDFVPVCPEDDVMGTPRNRMRLQGEPEQPRLVESESGRDWTPEMTDYVETQVDQLKREGLDGYVLKSGSPTCGLGRVMVHKKNGDPNGQTNGLFAEQLQRECPLLPVEDDGRLNDDRLRENFIEQVFCYHRWRRFLERDPGDADLQRFHRQHKLTLMSHDQNSMRELGRLVAGSSDRDVEDWSERLWRYGERFMDTLSEPAPRRRHVNVLQHVMGYLDEHLTDGDRTELTDLIEQYRHGQVPLVVPITLLKHHFRRHPVDWIMEQTYLNPYPDELMLRNHV